MSQLQDNISTEALNRHFEKVMNEKDSSRRNQFVDSLYTNFANTIDKATTLKKSELDKYSILFSKTMLDNYIKGKLEPEEIDSITQLSQEFYSRVNPQKEITVVDDHTDRVITVLPPLHMRIRHLSQRHRDVIDKYQEAISNNDGVPGGVGQYKEKKATVELTQSLINSQDKQEIMDNIKNFDKRVNEAETALGLRQSTTSEQPQAKTTPETSNEYESCDSPDFFDFDPVEE